MIASQEATPTVPGLAPVLELDGDVADVLCDMAGFLLASPSPALVAVDVIRILKHRRQEVKKLESYCGKDVQQQI